MTRIRLPSKQDNRQASSLLTPSKPPIITPPAPVPVPTTRINVERADTPIVVPSPENSNNQPIFDNLYCDIALLSNAYPHYTGGRYYDYMLHLMLLDLGYNCVLYTNLDPIFNYDFELYKEPRVRLCNTRHVSLPCANAFWGTPLSGATRAIELGAYYHKPVRICVYDCPTWILNNPYIGAYFGMGDMNRSVEIRYTIQQHLKDIPDFKVFTLTKNAVNDWADWLGIDRSLVTAFPPSINSRVIDLFGDIPRKDWFVSVNRNDYRKCWSEVIKVCARHSDTHHLHAFTNKLDGIPELLSANRYTAGKFHSHLQVPDLVKFQYIKQAKALICASHFEGFGMWFAEALRCGIPVVCYDLKSLEDYKHPHLYKVPCFDYDAFQEKVDWIAEQPPIRFDPVKDFDYEVGLKTMAVNINLPPKTIPDFDDVAKPQFTRVGTIFRTMPIAYHFNSVYNPISATQQRSSYLCWKNILSHVYYNKPDTHWEDVKDQLTIFTISTFPRKTILEACCDHLGIDLVVVRETVNGEWKHNDRLNMALEAYKTHVKTPYVLHLDATDVVIAGDLRRLFTTLEELKCKVLYAAEKGCHPENEEIANKQRNLCPYPDTPFTSLCSGMSFGRTEDWIASFAYGTTKTKYETPNPGDCNSDQGKHIQTYLDKYPEVQIDWTCRVFYDNDYVTDASEYLIFA